MSRAIGVYMCPRGVFGLECAFGRAGVRVDRSFAFPQVLTSAGDAAQLLARALGGVGARHVSVSIAVRGFGAVQHVLALPPAADSLLSPVVEREMRRLEPELQPSTFGWTPMPGGDDSSQANPLRQLSVGGAPIVLINALESAVTSTGNTLEHVTVLAASMQCIKDEFFAETTTAAVVAPLPDGPLIGFAIDGALRLIIEPPLEMQGDDADVSALAEELELGAVFLRQQFRGAEMSRVALVARREQFAGAESVIAARIGTPVERLAIADLDAAGAAALGAILDSRAPHPLSLAGRSATRQVGNLGGRLHAAATVALVLALVVGGWSVFTAWQVRRTTGSLVIALRRIDQESYGLVPANQTAQQRKLIQDARAAIREVDADRLELQRTIAQIASASTSPVQLDSLVLDRVTDGWTARLAGRAGGITNARAVQVLSDFYGALPRMLSVQDLTIEKLAYADSTTANSSPEVSFSISFGVRSPEGR